MSEASRRTGRAGVAAAALPLTASVPLAGLGESVTPVSHEVVALAAAAAAAVCVAAADGSGRVRFWRTFCYAAVCLCATPLGAFPSYREGYHRADELLYLIDRCPMWMALLFGSAAGTALAFTIWPPGAGGGRDAGGGDATPG